MSDNRDINQPLLSRDNSDKHTSTHFIPDPSNTTPWLLNTEHHSPLPSPLPSPSTQPSSLERPDPSIQALLDRSNYKPRSIKRTTAGHARARRLPWICIDDEGRRTFLHADKRALIASTGLNIPIRDMRLLDYQLVQSDTTVLVRDNAMIVCMEHVRCIVTADRAIIPKEGAEQNPLTARFVDVLEEAVLEWSRQRKEFQRQEAEAAAAITEGNADEDGLGGGNAETGSFGRSMGMESSMKEVSKTGEAFSDMEDSSSMSNVRHELPPLPFELVVMETALKELVACLSMQIMELEGVALPALDALTKTVNSSNLERVRKVKTRHQRLILRCEALRDELQRFLHDDDDMARMCLTRRKEQEDSARMAAEGGGGGGTYAGSSARYFNASDSFSGAAAAAAAGGGGGYSSSPPGGPSIFGSLSRRSSYARARVMSMTPGSPPRTTSLPSREALFSMGPAAAAAVEEEADAEAQQEVENLLESYYMEVDMLYDKLVSVGEYTKDTEEYINIELDSSRNRLIRMDIILSVAAFAIMPFNLMAGILGENLVIPEEITGSVYQFYGVNFIAACFCGLLFYLIMLYMRFTKLI